MEERVKQELMLYRLREIENEDMNLKIQELSLADRINSPGFEERHQSSKKCKNNDSIMNEIEILKHKIRLNEISNKRVDNALRLLEKEESEIIRKIYIDKNSLSQTALEVSRNRKGVKKKAETSIIRIAEFIKW